MRANLLNRVKREFEWDSYVQEHHTVKWTPTEELRICCPLCGEDKFKCYINPVKKVFNCFKCNFKLGNYDVFDFVSITEGITRYQAMARLIREYSAVTPDDDEMEAALTEGLTDDHQTAAAKISDIKTIKYLPKGLVRLEERTEENARFWDYLTGRGLTPFEIRAIQAHYTPESSLAVYDKNGKRRGDLANRVVVPIYGGQHELVSWQGRDITIKDKGELKYLMAPESEVARTLWPYVKPFDKHAVLVEGVYDCLAVRRIPQVSAYATFSKKISLDQMLRLKTWGIEEVTLFWDKRDAKPEMIKAIPELHMHFNRVYVSRMTGWPDNQDAGNMLADSAGADKLREALKDRVDTYDDMEFARWVTEF